MTPEKMKVVQKLLSRTKTLPNGCIVFVGSFAPGGYGQIRAFGRLFRANRLSWELFVGEIPPKIEVCHNCPGGDNPACINPSHLWLGTHKQNMDDRDKKGKQPTGEKNVQSKITAETVVLIRKMRADGKTYQSICDETGLSIAHVFRIVNRQRWGHIQ